MTWQFVLTGLLIGTLVGMTGMGGGSLMTPILVIVFGFKPTLAVGTDIVHGAIFKTVGAIRHRRLGTVHAQLSGWMFTGRSWVLKRPFGMATPRSSCACPSSRNRGTAAFPTRTLVI